jgi:hypothetical protein
MNAPAESRSKTAGLRALLLLASMLAIAPTARSGPAPFVICRGMCDASATITVGSQHFVVADDEDNILRVYSRENGGTPVQSFDLSRFLRVTARSPETDLEGAARIGDRVYWITSHALNKNGKDRPNRRRFFATKITSTNGAVVIEPAGRPYANLLSDLISDPRLQRFDLVAASRRGPKSGDALNIEGLCATPEGTLLIGFRNPIPDDKALIVPLLNPGELIAGGRARFGDPMLLNLGGLGVRSMTRSPTGYWIIGGTFDGDGRSHLYHWSGGADSPRRIEHPELVLLNPEAIDPVTVNGTERLFIVSDDGTLKIGGVDCKEVKNPNMKSFRATTIEP